MISVQNRVRAGTGTLRNQSPHHYARLRAARTEQAQVHRPGRRVKPGTTTHHCRAPRTHDPRGQQEGRTHPHRRRLARSWTCQPASPGRRSGKTAGYSRELCLPALRHRRGHTRLAYTEALEDEKGATAASLLDRAKAWFAEHGITSIERIVTDNGACYRSKVFAESFLPARQQRIKPYTPQHNGKVERYNRILAEEFLYARTWQSEQERADALVTWNLHYYHRPHGAHDGRPVASAAPVSVHNVLASYT